MTSRANCRARSPLGIGNILTCATRPTKLNDEKAGIVLGVWLAGYITTLSRTTPHTCNLIGRMKESALFQGIVDHCAKTPTDLVETAAYTVLETAAYPTRKTSGLKSPPHLRGAVYKQPSCHSGRNCILML